MAYYEFLHAFLLNCLTENLKSFCFRCWVSESYIVDSFWNERQSEGIM